MKLKLLVVSFILVTQMFSQSENKLLKKENLAIYDSITTKMHVIPGQWRPMFGSEQVAWVSPPWESQGYLWLDFPEAIWVEGQLVYLGHINKRFPTLFPEIKSAEWKKIDNKIYYEQDLPNGVSFGGEVYLISKSIVGMKLWIKNSSTDTLKDVRMQTCSYLNELKEFDKNTNDNKFVHVSGKCWVSLREARAMDDNNGAYHVGWLGGPKVVDRPVIITQSKISNHLLAFTWFGNTFSLVGNLEHPCVHADPTFYNVLPGERKEINGELIFFEGEITEFEKIIGERISLNKNVKQKNK